jgi:cell fate regulator YaaT (PSP1 superfamily)
MNNHDDHRAEDINGQDTEYQSVWAARIFGIYDTVLLPITVPDLTKGQKVIINSKYGLDLAIVLGRYSQTDGLPYESVEFVRIATEDDWIRAQDFAPKAREAERVFRRMIENRKISMKPVGAHFLLDGDKLLFFFTSEHRVDFRDLVRDLVSHFHLRIELRQIGVRDESRILGGRGVCGRTLCCHGITDNLQPVSIKMAKVQNLSLNSVKISGPCGRLLCCLAFEFEAYQQELHDLPREGEHLWYSNESQRIIEVNPISRRIVTVNRDGVRQSLKRCEFAFQSEKKRWVYNECAFSGQKQSALPHTSV